MAEGRVGGVYAPRLPAEPGCREEKQHAYDRGHHALVVRPDCNEHAVNIGEPRNGGDGEAQDEVREKCEAIHLAALCGNANIGLGCGRFVRASTVTRSPSALTTWLSRSTVTWSSWIITQLTAAGARLSIAANAKNA